MEKQQFQTSRKFLYVPSKIEEFHNMDIMSMECKSNTDMIERLYIKETMDAHTIYYTYCMIKDYIVQELRLLHFKSLHVIRWPFHTLGDLKHSV